jgi:RNase H-fold protein (predicted Holliday junction resolvase)
MRRRMQTPKILGLDISTKTIGFALFEEEGLELLELTHFSPIIKPRPDDLIEELIKKALAFEKKLESYKNMGIQQVIIEQPLLTSNNVYTVGTLMRFNALVSKVVFDVLGVVPKYISTYDSRKYAFPELYSENNKGKKVLFGAYPKGCDKKQIIWELVASKEPQITWLYTRNNTLKKENFDMTDAYACVLGYVNAMKEKSSEE